MNVLNEKLDNQGIRLDEIRDSLKELNGQVRENTKYRFKTGSVSDDLAVLKSRVGEHDKLLSNQSVTNRLAQWIAAIVVGGSLTYVMTGVFGG